MRFFFSDSADTVDADFDPLLDSAPTHHTGHRRRQHAHEHLPHPPYDGVLVSRAIIGGRGLPGAKYSQQQRNRLYAIGIRDYLACPPGLPVMGDSGSFTYHRLGLLPRPASELVAFYDNLGFDYGASADHLIPQKQHRLDDDRVRPSEITTRAEETLRGAADFLRTHVSTDASFTPVGVAQGWSPKSLARYSRKLTDMGYRWIGLGGLVGKDLDTVFDCVAEVRSAIPNSTRLHLFGLPPRHARRLVGLGIDTFDSSSPMVRAVKDSSENYLSTSRAFAAIRIPRLTDGPRNRIDPDQFSRAARLEVDALATVRAYAQRRASLDDALSSVIKYEALAYPERRSLTCYRETLAARPWEHCTCRACTDLGVEIVIHRGMNRNKRRGFHNLHVTYSELSKMQECGDLLQVPCIRAMQGHVPVYSFVVSGKQILRFASVIRARRDDSSHLSGYQRPEVADHIAEIANYLQSNTAFLPNSIVIAFRGGISFTEDRRSDPGVSVGSLEITASDHNRSGWIVDGQQRVAALRSLAEKDIPVSVVAFESESEEQEREQFVLVNNTRPLPKSLVYEMLPSIDAVPPRLKRRQSAYQVLELLISDPESPFHNRVVTATSRKSPQTNIKDVSVLRMIESSFKEGLLIADEEDPDTASRHLIAFWNEVKQRYPAAWVSAPRRSRLTHGTGIAGMGYLMDAIAIRTGGTPTSSVYRSALESLGDLPWMSGVWPFAQELLLPWNELQNTGRHVDLLANYLIRLYRKHESQE